MEMGKFKIIMKDYRVILLLSAVILSLLAISPSLDTTPRLAIRGIAPGSAAEDAGMQSPSQDMLPRQRDVLISIDQQQIHTLEDYYDVVDGLMVNQTINVQTRDSRLPYTLNVRPELNETVIGYETKLVNETNQTTNETYQVEEEVPIIDGSIIGVEDIGISLYPAPMNNIRLGLDLQGGVRVMLEPDEPVTDSDMAIIISNLEQRLNVYGMSDVMIRDATDLEGNQFIIVEIPGADEEEVRALIGDQGRFEAKIADGIAFSGGDDIRHVCRTAECSGLDPQRPCQQAEDGSWFCNFRFSVTLSREAAERQADLTRDLEVVYENGQEYLSENIKFYLDDELVSDLRIGADLRGRASTDISISGSGTGPSREAAIDNAIEEMRRMQTYLITGSLPVSLTTVKTDAISPVFGEEFLENIILVGLLALVTVATVVLVRYRKVKVVVPMLGAMVAQVIVILGVAALMRWNLDIAAMVGIIISLGSSVDHLIVITDSVIRGDEGKNISWKEKIKGAFSIIFTAYITTVTAMALLFVAGAGLLRGFALTTILGVSVGVLLTRPAFSVVVKTLLDE